MCYDSELKTDCIKVKFIQQKTRKRVWSSSWSQHKTRTRAYQGWTGTWGHQGFPWWAGPWEKEKDRGKKVYHNSQQHWGLCRGLGRAAIVVIGYTCVHVSLPMLIANHMSSMWVSPTHFLRLLQLSLVNHTALTVHSIFGGLRASAVWADGA